MVVCLGARELFVQNIRVPKLSGDALEKTVVQEVSSRIPFSAAEAEVRFLEAEDVRQGDAVKREIVVLACHRPVLERALAVVERAGLRPVAVDVEPVALVRCYARQYRREEDRQQRSVFVHVGATNTAVVIARGDDALFVKYIDVGGKHLDDAVVEHLKMNATEASSVRRHNGDRRADQQDAEVARERVGGSASCDRSPGTRAFVVHPLLQRDVPRPTPFAAGPDRRRGSVNRSSTGSSRGWNCAANWASRCEAYEPHPVTGRKSQWDVATGLALRQVA